MALVPSSVLVTTSKALVTTSVALVPSSVLVTTSKALVTTSKALVTNSFLLLLAWKSRAGMRFSDSETGSQFWFSGWTWAAKCT